MSTGLADGVRELAEESGLERLRPQIAEYVAAQRWSGARAGGIEEIAFADAVQLADAGPKVVFCVVSALLDGGERSARWALPIGLRPIGDPLAERAPTFLIGEITVGDARLFAYDAVGDPAYIHWLWKAMREQRAVRTAAAELRFAALDPAAFELEAPDVRWLGAEQSNTSMILAADTFLKHLRRLEGGPSHELEMAQALDDAGFTHRAPLLGTGLYAPRAEAASLLVLVQPYLHNGTEGWALALTSLRDLYADAEEMRLDDAGERHAAVDEQGGAFTAEAARLGVVVAQMHTALASRSLPENMAPQPITAERLAGWAEGMNQDLDALLRRTDPALQPLREARGAIVARFQAVRELEPRGLCTRIHGDLHLGQVLRTDSGWFILDFEGEPDRAPQERRALWSPLRDVAGMLRSFDYAAAAALMERLAPGGGTPTDLEALGDAWSRINRDSFWAAYLEAIDGSGLLPPPGAALTLRRAFEVQKAIYEVAYELGHRPGWARIPIRFLLQGLG